MKITVDTTLDIKLVRAASLAQEFFDTQLHLILGVPRFTYTDLTPEQVFNKIASNLDLIDVKILPWRPLNPWTAAIATTFKSKPGEIYINVRKVKQRSVADYVGSTIHECLHLPPFNFSHGSNSPKGKENSVNFRVGALAGEWARGRQA